ncbi:hypothetical protein BD779DRAFT_1551728 [Infundibulicybe gibba]|nr:hypothetical protein BD779DRAFT_1551728 [Infundibulicybe gibba]
MSNSKAQTAKDKGNAAFKSGDYPAAIGHYTAAILADKSDPTYPLNRAAAYLKLGKNQDAERDCTTTLSLNQGNVKALFRRGQARVGMEKIKEARDDFEAALKLEPKNAAVAEELKKLNVKADKAKVAHATSNSATTTPKPPTPPVRRRVPIKIIEGPNTSASPTQNPNQAPIRDGPSDSPPPSDLLSPVSSRPLAPEATSFPPPPRQVEGKPGPLTSTSDNKTATAPPAPTPAATTQEKKTFQAAKNARDAAKPTRVGGGIFRSSGQYTIFPSRGDPPISTQTTAATSVPGASGPSPSTPTENTPRRTPSTQKPPKNMVEFTRAWEAADMETRWDIISSISPASLPTVFQTSLEPSMLISILKTFRDHIDLNPGPTNVKSYLDALARVPRFGTVVLFLSADEKEIARMVWERVGVISAELSGPWRCVAKK